MAAILRVVGNEDRTDAQKVADWIASADDEVLACRGQGHRWPKLIKPGRLPRGMDAKPVRESQGQVELVATCPDCKKSRRMITMPGGEVNFPEVKWRAYKEDPAGRYKAPPGVRITPSMARNETYRRFSEAIIAQAKAESAPTSVPPVVLKPGVASGDN